MTNQTLETWGANVKSTPFAPTDSSARRIIRILAGTRDRHARILAESGLLTVNILTNEPFRSFTPSVALSNADETDIKTAILYAMGVRMEEIAARLDRKADTLYKRRTREHDRLYSWVEKLVQSELERNVAARVTKIQEQADIKQIAYKKAWELKLRALNQGLREGRTVVTVDGEEIVIDEPAVNAVQASIAMNVVDRIEGKPLDRKAILTRNENINRKEIAVDDLDELIDEVRRLSAPREPQPLLAAVPEADLVGPSN